MKFPDLPGSGATYIPRRFFEQLKDYVLAITPQPSPDILPQTRPGGTAYLLAARPAAGGASAAPVHPYQGADASDGSTPKVSIRWGSHNSVVPTIGGTPLGLDPAGNVLTLGVSAKIVYVQLDLDGDKQVTAASIHSSNDTAPPAGTSSTAYQTLFAVAVTVEEGRASVAVSANVGGSQAYQYCLGSHLFGLI